ncbi:MAG: hypothetical protein CMM07_07390 [Rhodopirellula sp.]|nr:hypothetical protein [Rhodopirellula sp.]
MIIPWVVAKSQGCEMDSRTETGYRTKRMTHRSELEAWHQIVERSRFSNCKFRPEDIDHDKSCRIIFCWRGNREPSKSFPKNSITD